ncbi:hypothetical protein KC906_04415 [Candidatus Kaiserbacteria bacterium]|nr:hypothetical protein [Candidatus Kaiserbacteria bacterium]MCB9812613.1 hypothetical protein [Candidatus Nomurabacteria bacterium]
MTTGVRTLTVACLSILLATPLSGEVFAQQNSNEITSTTSATTTESVLAVEPEAESELWYKSERIFGRIDAGDFVVGPGRTEIEVAPGETVIQEVTVTNRISGDRSFLLEVEDITGSRDGSSAVSLMGAERGPYSIKDYISFPETELNLDLGERARIPVIITVPPDAEPGGYYGSVLVSTIRTNEDGAAAAPRSPIIARVGSLFFLRVLGDAVTEGRTQSISVLGDKWWHESGPIELGILYENTGSIHVNPYGELSITNMFGEEVGFVELEPWFVLPNSLRVREVVWDREFLLGRYEVTARINRGYDDIVDEVTVAFWVLPWKIVGGLFLGLFIIIFGIRAFFRTFEFKRKGA